MPLSAQNQTRPAGDAAQQLVLSLSDLRHHLAEVKPRGCGFEHHTITGELPRCPAVVTDSALDCAHSKNFWINLAIDRLCTEKVLSVVQRDALRRFLSINDDALIVADELAIDIGNVFERRRNGQVTLALQDGDRLVRREGIASDLLSATASDFRTHLQREQRIGVIGRSLLQRTLLRALDLCLDPMPEKRGVASRCLTYFIEKFGSRDPLAN